MRQKLQLIIFCLLCSMINFQMKAQSSLIVDTQDGNEINIPLSTLQKITFSDNNIVFNKIDGSSVNYQMSLISKLYFDAYSSGIEDEIKTEIQSLVVYPNPATSYIKIETRLSDACLVCIFNLDGRLALCEKISSSDNIINISALPLGFYIVKVNNQVSKFLKR